MRDLIRELFQFASQTRVVVVEAVRAARRLMSDVPAPEHRAPFIDAKLKAELKHEFWKAAAYFAVFLTLMGTGGFLVAVSGIMPIKASSGHWVITRWFLDFSSQRSVATHTFGLEAPSLDQPGLVLKGAGTYESNCRACHGSPALRNPRVAQQMTPDPPYLPSVLSEWRNAELFYIVKHGIKFTGMPAWPAQQRDDEVWAMVAFLSALPSLDDEAYRQLVYGEAASDREAAPLPDLFGPQTVPRSITVNCGRCHGVDGLSRAEPAFPRLAGQRSDYLSLSLQAFAREERHSGIMEPIAAALSVDEVSELALYYSKLPKPLPSSAPQETALAIQRGAAIAQRGIPSQRVPSCVACHGPSTTARNPVYPDHRGQHADYLVLQLELFKEKQRGGTPYAHLMHPVAANLNPDQMRDVALYYASLTSAPDGPVR
jgi:cytochrome c553